MSYDLFERRVRLILADFGTEGTAFNQDLDITFTVKRTRTSEPNEADIRVMNLGRLTRGRFEKEFKRVRLEAGYIDNFDVIFAGDIKLTEHGRNGSSVATDIICGDSELAWEKAKVNRTYASGATVTSIVRDLVRDHMPNVTLGRLIGLDDFSVSRRPYVANGMVRDRLNEIARTYDARWSIQNGVFEMVANDRAGSRVRIVSLSASSGLIESPKQTEKGVRVRCLMNPAIKPNDSIEIVSPSLTGGQGIYRVNEVVHRGSTFGEQFYSLVDCQRMAEGTVETEPNATQATQTNDRGVT